MFLVHRGSLTLEFEDGDRVTIGAGEFYVVPRGVAHKPIAREEVEIVLFEPVETAHTGEVKVAETRDVLTWL